MELVDDADDWRRALRGSGKSFASIFDRHEGAVRRQAARLCGRGPDVEDVVAIVFQELWRRRETVPVVSGSVLPWLIVTTGYVSNNLRRSRRRHQALLARLPRPIEFADPAADDRDGDLLTALRSLKQTDQQVLVLCVLEDLSERDAAAALGIPVGTIKSRLHRARRRLADQFQRGAAAQRGVRHGYRRTDEPQQSTPSLANRGGRAVESAAAG